MRHFGSVEIFSANFFTPERFCREVHCEVYFGINSFARTFYDRAYRGLGFFSRTKCEINEQLVNFTIEYSETDIHHKFLQRKIKPS